MEYQGRAFRHHRSVDNGSGTYIFHVGPMAELGVRDAGASPAELSTGQRAYTMIGREQRSGRLPGPSG